MPLGSVLETLAADAHCDRINTEDSNEFAKVWIACFVFGASLSMLALATSWWGGNPADPEWDAEDAKACTPDAAVEPSPKSRFKSRTRAWQNRTRECNGPWYGDPSPDLAKAKRHLRTSSPTDEQGLWRSVWRTRLSQLSEVGGTGTELYFILLRDLGVCFTCMAAITSPITAFSFLGDFAPSSAPLWTRTTIANLGNIVHGDSNQEDRLAIVGCQGMPISLLTKYFGWLDLASALLLLLCLVRFRFVRARATARADDAEQVTCADFAVEIDRLPARLREDHANYEQLLREHLYCLLGADPVSDQAGGLPPKVQELTLVRDFSGRLRALKRHALLQASLVVQRERHDERAVAKLEKCLASKELSLREVAKEEDLPVIRAYAILNTTADVRQLLLRRWGKESFCLYRCVRRRKVLLFGGAAVRLRKAPEPSDVLWEHQDARKQERLARRAVVLLAYALATTVSLALVYFLSYYASSQTQAAQGLEGSAQCDGFAAGLTIACDLAKAKTWSLEYVANRTSADLQCFCLARSQSEVLLDAALSDACGDWLVDAGRALAITVACSLLIVFINIAFRMLLTMFAEIERPRSASTLNSSLMVKLAVAQTLNTSFVILLVNYNGLHIFTGKYNDFGRGWYAAVGATLLSNMMLHSFVPPLMNFAMMLWVEARRWFSRSRIDHQAHLLELYTNPPFDISDRFAEVVTTVFCTMTYSSGLPALNLFAAAYMFTTYWVDKLVLLRGSERPPFFNVRMPLQASHFMLYAIPLHCLFAIGMYGQPCIFPSQPLGSYWAVQSPLALGSVGGQPNGFLARAWRESTWMFTVLLASVAALWCWWWVCWMLNTTLGEFVQAFCRACRLQRAERILPAFLGPDEADDMDWAMARKVIERTCPPASYKLEQNHEFAPLMRFLRPSGGGGGPPGEAAHARPRLDRSRPEAPGVASTKAFCCPPTAADLASRPHCRWQQRRRRPAATGGAERKPVLD